MAAPVLTLLLCTGFSRWGSFTIFFSLSISCWTRTCHIVTCFISQFVMNGYKTVRIWMLVLFWFCFLSCSCLPATVIALICPTRVSIPSVFKPCLIPLSLPDCLCCLHVQAILHSMLDCLLWSTDFCIGWSQEDFCLFFVCLIPPASLFYRFSTIASLHLLLLGPLAPAIIVQSGNGGLSKRICSSRPKESMHLD